MSCRNAVRVAAAVVAAAALWPGAGIDAPSAGRLPWRAIAARAGDGTAPLDVDSDPSGARVLVDGKEIGTTPVSNVAIAAGRRTIRVEAAEHDAFETTIDVSAGGRTRVPTVELVPWPKLTLDPRAGDVAMTIDGAAPAPSGRIAPGRRTIVLTRPGHAPQTHEIEVASGRDIALQARVWSEFQVRIDLTGLAKDAVAEFDGVRVSGTLTFAEPRRGTLRLTRPGHFPREFVLDLALGAKFEPGDDWTKVPAVASARAKGVGDAKANAAVKAGLDWLARHQSKDGRWDCDGFPARCSGGACRGEGESVFDPGVTGLAVQAFLGAGETHLAGAHGATVAGALAYLRDVQDSEGCVGPRTSVSFQFNHASAAAALIDAFWITNDRALREPAALALRFALESRNPYLAWRYGVRDGDNDSAATIYQSLVVRTAEWTNLAPVPDWRAGALSWLDKMTDPSEGRTGYQSRGGEPSRWSGNRGRPTRASTWGPLGSVHDRSDEFPNDDTESLTAGALLVHRLLAADDPQAVRARSWALVARRLPFEPKSWVDLHYALWGSLAHAQDPKAGLAEWRKATVAELVARQFPPSRGCGAGSWDAQTDPFGAAGGQTYATAMALLALEAPNRFPVVPPPPKRPSKPGPK